jgi:hypothetical protein
MSAETAIASAVTAIKAAFPSAVVEWRNASWICTALRSSRMDERVIDPNSGAVDPDAFNVRVFVAECGPVKAGDTIFINDQQATVEDLMPDSIGQTLLVSLRRKRLT